MEKENGKNATERMQNTLIFLSIKELWKYFKLIYQLDYVNPQRTKIEPIKEEVSLLNTFELEGVIEKTYKAFLSIREYLHVGNTTFKEWNNYKKTFEKKIRNLRQKYKNYIYFVDEDTQKTCDRFIKSLAIWLVFKEAVESSEFKNDAIRKQINDLIREMDKKNDEIIEVLTE